MKRRRKVQLGVILALASVAVVAVLIGPDQPWMSTMQFLDKLDENLKARMVA